MRQQPAAAGHRRIVEPLYDVDDAEAAIERLQGRRLRPAARRWRRASRPRFHDAGHILGSAIIELDVEQPDGTPAGSCSPGDIGRPNTPILRDPTAMIDGADYVLMESTYGGREHEPEEEAIRMLAEAVSAVADHIGVLLIPAFAIGRTQEIVWELDRCCRRARSRTCRCTSTRRWRRRPATSTARYPGYYDEETHGLLAGGRDAARLPGRR